MPGERFVDAQLAGPYRLWHHTHEFAPDGDGGTLMRDTVRYALPYWPLGEVAHPLVARDLAAIFDYRATAVAGGSLDGERARPCPPRGGRRPGSRTRTRRARGRP